MSNQENIIENNDASSAFSLEERDNGVAILSMDVPGESMNTLKIEFSEQISGLFGLGLPVLFMAFPEPLKLGPPFVSEIWWLLYVRLVPLRFR